MRYHPSRRLSSGSENRRSAWNQALIETYVRPTGCRGTRRRVRTIVTSRTRRASFALAAAPCAQRNCDCSATSLVYGWFTCCANSGQDTLSLAQLGADATGVDISDEAIAFATRLAADTNGAATFVRADIYDWLEAVQERGERFDLVFSSYGVVHWISDLDMWVSGITAILRPGGAFVLVDFHPAERMFSRQWRHISDYFPAERIDSLDEGVIDYITRSPGKLSPFGYEAGIENFQNPYPSHLFRYTLGQIVTAIGSAGLHIDVLEEYPHSIAMRFERMREIADYRTLPPEDVPSVPLLYGLRAHKDHS